MQATKNLYLLGVNVQATYFPAQVTLMVKVKLQTENVKSKEGDENARTSKAELCKLSLS